MRQGHFAVSAALTLAAALLFAGPASVAQSTEAASPAQPAPPAAASPFVWPTTLTNAKVLPADIGADRLRGTMVGFSNALGVRCSFCHVGGEDVPLAGRDFASDANPNKDIARGMLRMTWTLNRETLPAIAGVNKPQVSCYTCHRGTTKPLVAPLRATPPTS